MGEILQHDQIIFVLILQYFKELGSSFLLRCFTSYIIVCSYICVSLIFFFKLSHFTLLIKSFFQGGVIVLTYTNRYTQMNIYVWKSKYIIFFHCVWLQQIKNKPISNSNVYFYFLVTSQKCNLCARRSRQPLK